MSSDGEDDDGGDGGTSNSRPSAEQIKVRTGGSETFFYVFQSSRENFPNFQKKRRERKKLEEEKFVLFPLAL